MKNRDNQNFIPSAPPPPYEQHQHRPPIYTNISRTTATNPKSIVRKKTNKPWIANLLILAIWIAFLGIVTGAYFGIEVLLTEIQKLKSFVKREQQIFEDLSTQISEELKKTESLPKYRELTSEMNRLIDLLPHDQALSYFLSTHKLDIESYYKYCNLYLAGDFQKFPFAVDHYRPEYTWVGTSYNDSQNMYHPEGRWDSREVFDYREYLEIRGSVNTEIAQKFRNLYSQRDYMKVEYRKLVEIQEQHSNVSYGENIKIGGMIAGIVCICIALLAITGLSVYFSRKLMKKKSEEFKLEVLSDSPKTTTRSSRN